MSASKTQQLSQVDECVEWWWLVVGSFALAEQHQIRIFSLTRDTVPSVTGRATPEQRARDSSLAATVDCIIRRRSSNKSIEAKKNYVSSCARLDGDRGRVGRSGRRPKAGRDGHLLWRLALGP
jgi:hypothetical protein